MQSSPIYVVRILSSVIMAYMPGLEPSSVTVRVLRIWLYESVCPPHHLPVFSPAFVARTLIFSLFLTCIPLFFTFWIITDLCTAQIEWYFAWYNIVSLAVWCIRHRLRRKWRQACLTVVTSQRLWRTAHDDYGALFDDRKSWTFKGKKVTYRP
jgi:hypothetical protein